MEFLIESRQAILPDDNSPREVVFAQTLHSDAAPKYFGQFQLSQTIIPLEGGQHSLRLLKPLTLKIIQNGRCQVQDWGIEVDITEVPYVPREIARRFLFLLSAAENERLKEQDQADLVEISAYIDFRQFTIDRSPPRYQEGIVQSSHEKVIVEWHDGKRETLIGKPARALEMVNPGEKFSAFVKLGNQDRTVAIDRVSLLGPASEYSNENWSAWPTKN